MEIPSFGACLTNGLRHHFRRYSSGVSPVSRLKYFEKKLAFGKWSLSAISTAVRLSWRNMSLAVVTMARSIHSFAVTPLAFFTTVPK